MVTPPNESLLLEVAIASVADALAAETGRADRLKLDAVLAVGGRTPSLGTFVEVKATVRMPVMVMVRPRSGGFAYSEAHLKTMQRDVALFLEHGADGLVFGILTDKGEIDVQRCQPFLKQVGDREAVFHRAFDVTPDPFVALQQLIDLGFRRVMTSDQEETAYNGSALIAELIQRAAGQIEVLPAGGINRFTVADVVVRTACDQVHASLRGQRADSSVCARPQVSFGGRIKVPEDRYDVTSEAAVAELRGCLDHVWPGRVHLVLVSERKAPDGPTLEIIFQSRRLTVKTSFDVYHGPHRSRSATVEPIWHDCPTLLRLPSCASPCLDFVVVSLCGARGGF